MVASEVLWGQVPAPDPNRALPPGLLRCRRVVAVTVHLPEFLLAASGLLQRLGAAGVRTDVLVAAATDERADLAAGAAMDRLRVPDLARHRLSLPVPIGPDRADDLLAALSELVGFDPESGVYCMAPAADGEASPGQAVAVVAEAARRIRKVYGLPLVRFTTTPNADSTRIELDPKEWARKCEALAACASDVAPLTGYREYFGI
ncbi:hypothetical protein [Pseudonocardia acaciae]|uniref:hypothetical protein n=1 Tax=Pseudonocardia acaciae TaxID=551276 RepID=UPI0012EEC51F|nr:hypothetical protein [Pseudonocardia acaciae]